MPVHEDGVGTIRTTRTYGRARIAGTVDIGSSGEAAPSVSATGLLERFAAGNVTWRQELALIDAEASAHDEEDEARRLLDQLRKRTTNPPSPSSGSVSDLDGTTPIREPLDDARPRQGPLAPTTSMSSLTELPPSTPPDPPEPPLNSSLHRPQGASSPRSPRGQLQDDSLSGPEGSQSAVPFTAKCSPALATARLDGLASELFGQDESFEGAESRLPERPKSLPKSLQDQARRDVAAAMRNRQAEVSRPDPRRKPMSQWLTNAAAIASAVKEGSPSPEAIRQFTPSSAAHIKAPSATGRPFRPPVKLSSSPTLRVSPRYESYCDDDDDSTLTLEQSLQRLDEKEKRAARIKAIKAAALKAQAAIAPNDDDFIVLPDSPREAAPTVAGPSRQSRKRPTTETHIAFAAHQFDHANLRRANGGSRPAGQKKGRDQAISQTQLDIQMRAKHLEMVRSIAREKEAKYGKGRSLPAVEVLPVSTFEPTTSAASLSDDEGSDYSPESEEVEDEEYGEQLGEQEKAESETSAADDGDKENRPLSPGPEEETLPRRRPARARRRIDLDSDDESDAPVVTTEEKPDGALGDAFALDFAADGGFSQFFAETQVPSNENAVDAVQALREVNVPPTHMLLPSVVISETQKKRDNAMIAAEFDKALPEPEAPGPVKQYLNSQGFFTQTRPGHYMSQAEHPVSGSKSTQDATQNNGSSSTLLNSGELSRQEDDIEERLPLDDDRETLLTRLRHRTKSASPPVPSAPNAFDVMHRAAQRAARQDAARPRDFALIEEQAEESDDDGGWGFLTKDNGDEADDEDGPEYLADLVDDTAVNEADKVHADERAAEKHREYVQVDDARREAEAKKVAEGFYRAKRRGNDFLSDEEDEDGKPRRLNKKQRRQRKLDREDELFKMDGTSSVFLQAYRLELESDEEAYEEAPMSPTMQSPVQTRSEQLLRARARQNRVEPRIAIEEQIVEESQFSIGRAAPRSVASEEHESVWSDSRRLTATRSVETYSKLVSEESNSSRRGGVGGVSVVVQKETNGPSVTAIPRKGAARQLGNSGSILLNRDDRFG